MAHEDQQKNNLSEKESNVERDQDHGNMNNGTIGGNMGTIGSSNEEDSNYSKNLPDEGAATVPGKTGEVAAGGSKANSDLRADASSNSPASGNRVSETEE